MNMTPNRGNSLVADRHVILRKLLAKAVAFAAQVHIKDVYWKGDVGWPYIFHCLAVADRLVLFQEKILGVLHDTYEDHPDTASLEVLQREFGSGIAKDVVYLARTKKETYMEYIGRVTMYPHLTRIKRADIEENLHQADGLRGCLIKRYYKALKAMEGIGV